MAATRPKTQVAVGSTQWVQTERAQLHKLVEQDVEEFTFAARNELVWLNEHMADVFNGSQRNFTEVFKTPGKLRGKTPRTMRKDNAQRAPLTDLFAPNPQDFISPARSTPFFQKVSKIQVASHDERKAQQAATTSKTNPKRGKENADSGYHGMTEDEMDVELRRADAGDLEQLPAITATTSKDDTMTDRRTEDSFVSAAEAPEPPIKDGSTNQDAEDDNATIPDEEMQRLRAGMIDHEDGNRVDNMEISIHEDVHTSGNEDQETPKAVRDSSSDTSSPEKPLVRKSSLNFASLPPRETLSGRRSQGTRRSSQRRTSTRESEQRQSAHNVVDDELAQQPIADATVAHNKSSTQLLHERINMLGQTRAPRTSKSIPAAYPVLPQLHAEHAEQSESQDEDDSWIAPITQQTGAADERTPQPVLAQKVHQHQQSMSTVTLASPGKAELAPEILRQKSSSVSAPNKASHRTPPTSPHKPNDGPLSASKSRLYSMLKSAKGMFATSAGVSAQAKAEVVPAAVKSNGGADIMDVDVSRMPGGFADEAASTRANDTTLARPLSAIFSPKKTRNSAGSDRKKQKAAENEAKINGDLHKLREKERVKAAQQKDDRARADRAREEQEERAKVTAVAQQEVDAATSEQTTSEFGPDLKSVQSTGKLRAPGRMLKPVRQAPPVLVRPVPVNIRVASQSQRLGPAQPAGPNTMSEDAAPPARSASAAGKAGAVRPGATSAASNARVKALEAAARKKERDDQAAARKTEAKKELERKRMARLEEEREVEQQRRAEEQRKAQEAKAAAQKQAEQRQAEQRRLEQQRREAAAAAAKIKAETELSEAMERERARLQHAAQSRADVPGTLRQLSKTVQEVPAKVPTAKRPLQRDADEQGRSGMAGRAMPAYQQQDAKRRRTNDPEEAEPRERHSVMAPPKRPSTMVRKETVSKFPHGYAHAPPPAAHHAQNIYKASIATQPIQAGKSGPMQPHETVKLSTARIPFADSANPPASTHPDPSAAKTPTAHTFKTPARPMPHGFAQSAKTRSSPAFPQGDNIALPDIHTDSEDDSDASADDDASPGTKNANASFRAPSWVASPALRDLLTQQQLVDPESVFGPIATLNMDEVFKPGTNKEKERLRRYRERGESAMWVESGDAVTSAEKRRDREMRERVVRDGGWSFTRE